jgi:hypothetical protein
MDTGIRPLCTTPLLHQCVLSSYRGVQDESNFDAYEGCLANDVFFAYYSQFFLSWSLNELNICLISYWSLAKDLNPAIV